MSKYIRLAAFVKPARQILSSMTGSLLDAPQTRPRSRAAKGRESLETSPAPGRA